MATSLIISQELNEKKLATLTNDTVKSALNQYFGELQTIGRATWTAYKSFALAYANMSKEVTKGKDGQDIERFKTKGQFYDFVGVNDSTGSLMLRAVAFNEVCLIDGKKLEEYGFTAGKVDMLSRVGADDFVKFLSFCKASKYGSLEELAGVSDKSLRAIIKAWEDAGRPEKAVPMKEAEAKKQEAKKQEAEKQEAEKQEAEKQEAEKQEAEKRIEAEAEAVADAPAEVEVEEQEITRESILADALAYTGIDKDNVNEFLKWLRTEMLKACKQA